MEDTDYKDDGRRSLRQACSESHEHIYDDLPGEASMPELCSYAENDVFDAAANVADMLKSMLLTSHGLQLTSILNGLLSILAMLLELKKDLVVEYGSPR